MRSEAPGLTFGFGTKSTLGSVGAIDCLFVDGVSGDVPYVYAISGYKPLTIDPPLPNAQISDLVFARAALNGGTLPLNFWKWDGQAFSGAGLGGIASPILPLGACGLASLIPVVRR